MILLPRIAPTVLGSGPRSVDFTADCPAGHHDALWSERPMESESVRGQTRLHIAVDCRDCDEAA